MEKNYWLISDIHGDYTPIDNFYRKHKNELSTNSDDNILIILGDVGAQYYLNKKDEFFKEKLSEYPFTYFCIRGNHEERPSVLAKRYPKQWHQEEIFNNLVWRENKYLKILYALDEGGEYKIANKSVLVIPGAYSVDKEYRIAQNWFWCEQEQLSQDEMNNILDNLKDYYDVILSHTCPLSWQPYIADLFLSQINQATVDTSMEKFLDKIVQSTSYSRYYFGHYHDNRDILGATMVFHEELPFGMTYSEYQKYCLTNF